MNEPEALHVDREALILDSYFNSVLNGILSSGKYSFEDKDQRILAVKHAMTITTCAIEVRNGVLKHHYEQTQSN